MGEGSRETERRRREGIKFSTFALSSLHHIEEGDQGSSGTCDFKTLSIIRVCQRVAQEAQVPPRCQGGSRRGRRAGKKLEEQIKVAFDGQGWPKGRRKKRKRRRRRRVLRDELSDGPD